MISASYPIQNSPDQISIFIGTPENLKPDQSIVKWTLQAPNYNKEGNSEGTDASQCVLLAYYAIGKEILEWEKASGNICEYYFMPQSLLESWVNSKNELIAK